MSATITVQPDEPEVVSAPMRVEKTDEQQKILIRRKRKVINLCSSNNNDYPIQYSLYDDYSMKREDKLGKLSTPVTLRNTDEQPNREKREKISPYWSWGYNDFLDDYGSDYPVYPTVHKEEANWSDTTSTFSSKLICHYFIEIIYCNTWVKYFVLHVAYTLSSLQFAWTYIHGFILELCYNLLRLHPNILCNNYCES